MTELTSRQQEILGWIQGFIAENGYPPTVREIGAAFGIRSTNGVADHLKALERKGCLERGSLKSRGLRLIGEQAASPFPSGAHAARIARAAVAHMDSFNRDDDRSWDETRQQLDEAIDDWKREQRAAGATASVVQATAESEVA